VTTVARRGLTLVGAALLAVAGWACDLNPQQLPPGIAGGTTTDSGSQNMPPTNGGADASSSPDASAEDGSPRVGDGGDGGGQGTAAEDAGDGGDAGDSGDAGEAIDGDAGSDQ
jgi:hypothetical protein